MRDNENNKPKPGSNTAKRQTDSSAKGKASRRDRRRNFIAGGGVAAGGAALGASGWLKPVVRTVVLPAHAQTSPGNGGSTTPTATTPTATTPTATTLTATTLTTTTTTTTTSTSTTTVLPL